VEACGFDLFSARRNKKVSVLSQDPFLTPQCARHETAPRREATTRREGAAATTRLEAERREERAAQGAAERRTAAIELIEASDEREKGERTVIFVSRACVI
jgi:hypothetical protein